MGARFQRAGYTISQLIFSLWLKSLKVNRQMEFARRVCLNTVHTGIVARQTDNLIQNRHLVTVVAVAQWASVEA